MTDEQIDEIAETVFKPTGHRLSKWIGREFARALLFESKPAAPEGVDPMADGQRSLADSIKRLTDAYCVQQPFPIPNQMALVWRADIGRLRNDWIRLNAWQESVHTERAQSAQAPAAPAQSEEPVVDDLAMLVRQLVHSLRKAEPSSSLADRAADYLKRKGLAGSPLRVDAPQPQPTSAVAMDEREAFETNERTRLGYGDDTLTPYAEVEGEYLLPLVQARWEGWQARAASQQATAAQPEQATQSGTPFPNCRFKLCDLPGQCRDEGKCHHPAIPSAQPEQAQRARILEEACAAIKAEDDRKSEEGYMLDSDDCIRVIRALLPAAQQAGGGDHG